MQLIDSRCSLCWKELVSLTYMGTTFGVDPLHLTIGRFDQDEAVMRSSSIDPAPVTRLDLDVPRSDCFIKCKGFDASRTSTDTLFR